jgi:predicted O-methyltransferase YrrM
VPLDLARARAIYGWMTDEELKWLARAARRCQIVVEAGCYQGRSTRALADHCPGVVYAVDPWEKMTKSFALFNANLSDHLTSGHVIQLRATLEQAMPTLEDFGAMKRARLFGILGRAGQADLVFIDDDHAYETVRQNIALGLQLVKRGGTICGHDYGKPTWPDVKRAVDEAFPAVNLAESIWWVQA